MNDIMTLEEVADYMRVSSRTVSEWVAKGEIPGGKLGTSWRFKRSEIEYWVTSKLTPRLHTDRDEALPISTVLKRERTAILNCSTKLDALNAMIDLCVDIRGVSSRKELANEVLKRESLMSTGMGLGVGVPHVRLSSLEELHMAVGLSNQAITDYESIDGTPIRLIVLIVAGRHQHVPYIQTLANVARIMKDEKVRKSLFSAQTAQSIYEVMINTDKK